MLEQTLAQSLFNVQMDSMRKKTGPMVLPLTKFRNIKEVQCFGFNLTDLDILIRHGYIQVNTGYVETNPDDFPHCAVFDRALRAGPIANVDNFKGKYNMKKLAEQMGIDENDEDFEEKARIYEEE